MPQASLLVVGDLGFYNSQTVPDLVQEVHGGQYDALLHIGDLAYDLQVWRERCVGRKKVLTRNPACARNGCVVSRSPKAALCSVVVCVATRDWQ